MEHVVLKLYVTGKTPRSQAAIDNLNTLLEQHREDYNIDLDIINVFDQPERAVEQEVFATPTLVKELPPPVRRIIGDLSDIERVLLGLEIVKGD